jgi:hypothetical protein
MSKMIAIPTETRARLAESMVAPRRGSACADQRQAGSPTAQEIRNVLAPPQQAPVMAYEHSESPAEGAPYLRSQISTMDARLLPALAKHGRRDV